jgi:hypothetical protein
MAKSKKAMSPACFGFIFFYKNLVRFFIKKSYFGWVCFFFHARNPLLLTKSNDVKRMRGAMARAAFSRGLSCAKYASTSSAKVGFDSSIFFLKRASLQGRRRLGLGDAAAVVAAVKLELTLAGLALARLAAGLALTGLARLAASAA